ncbi:developmental regulatory protein [Diplodia corticola]|uniref:Developmental regulatory protein n=1 Tax=Diplodia corticola TaxID=236234 RepID=A0A1J9RGS3_9PEZI|nr:developmental regulatory protein [Diplodia corticola]OJD31739.1 developmental regulatory protein [Diplodia corticola]
MAPSPQVRQVSSAVPLHHVQGRSCRPPGDIALLRQRFDDLPIRPADKDSNWPVPYDQLFDQYVDADLLDLSSDNTGEASSSDDLGNLFDISSSSNGSAAAKTSPMPHWDPSRHTEPEETWQQAWGYIGSKVAPAAPEGSQSSILPESRGKAVTTNPELFSLAAAPACSPQVPSEPFVFSAPSSPRPIVSSCEPKKFNSLPIRGSKRQTPSVIRRTASRGSFSPKMMRSTPYRTGYQEIWAKRVGAPPLSPPPSSKVSQEESHYGYDFSPNLPYTTSGEVADIERQLSFPNYSASRSQIQMTPVASPTTQAPSSARSSFHASSDPSNNPYLTHDLNEALQTPPQSSRLPSSSWNQGATAAFDFGSFSASSDYSQDREPQPWWSSTSVSQPSQPTTYHNGRHDFLGVSSASSDLAAGGLMIQCEPSSMASMLDAHAPDASSSFSTSSPVVYPSQMYTSNAMASTPTFAQHPHQQRSGAPPHPHPAARQHHMQQQQHHHHHQQITPPSRSPTSSPLHTPSVMPQQFIARSRRDSSQPCPPPSSRPRSHHRRKSSSHSSTGPSSTPRPASVGFVNYTPDDSRKILTGVAPSGSSKTKARREKEAAEKRRRLSQAAARAIIEAGGDLAALEREGLLYLPETKEMLASKGNMV